MSDAFQPGVVHPGVFPVDRPQYVNGVQMHVSPWDFVIAFQHQSVVGEVDGQPQVAAVPVGRFVMSPTHAKAMQLALAEVVSGYENQFGEIPDMRQLGGGTQ